LLSLSSKAVLKLGMRFRVPEIVGVFVGSVWTDAVLALMSFVRQAL
jgi:hypothetical protein